jgi:CubicO group peptidase (beta-lactamase class C family)
MKLLISTLTLFFTLNIFGQIPPPTTPSINDTAALLKEIQQVMKREHVPGLMISIVKGDSIVYAGGLGFANLEHKIPVHPNTLFHQNSVTKMFTAMAILKLVHAGKLNLKDELKKIAPEIKFQNRWEQSHPVRVVHLLEHTAGFDDVQLNRMYSNNPEKHQGLEPVMSQKSSFVSRWKPGLRMSYSNPGYEILGYLIEKFGGKPWGEFLRQEILLPIGMTDAVFNPTIYSQADYAVGYRFSKRGPLAFPFYSSIGNGAGAGLFASSVDMAKFLQLYIQNWQFPSGTWLPETYLNEMEKVHSTLAASHGLKLGYALGNDKFPNNSKVTFRGHFGDGEGFNSLVLYNREHKIGYAICNNGGKGLWPFSQII